MFEHTPNGGGALLKPLAMLSLALAIGLLSIAARNSSTARKLHTWLSNAYNSRNAVIWLSFALMFLLFASLTIAYELPD